MPASWRASDLTVLGVAAVGTIALTVMSFVLAPSRSTSYEDGSSYAAHPDGGRAAFILLKELGYSADRSFEALAALRTTPESTTLVLADPQRPPSQQDVRALRGFLERGGVVLATGTTAAQFLPGIPPQSREAPSPQSQPATMPGSFSEGVSNIEMASSTAKIPLESNWVPLFGGIDAPAVITARIGNGRAIWWADSKPLGNGGIGQQGHAELLTNALGAPAARTILWDEYYHGHTRTFWSYLAGTPLPAAGLQLGFIGALALFTYSRRRRPIRPRPLDPRTSPLEFVDTMGSLYQRAGTASSAVGTVLARFRRLLLSASGLPASSSDERLANVAAKYLSLDPGALSTLLSNAKAASMSPELTANQAVTLVAEMQAASARATTSKTQSVAIVTPGDQAGHSIS